MASTSANDGTYHADNRAQIDKLMVVKMVLGATVIIGFYCLGEITHHYLSLPIPGSVIGLVYLYLYLSYQKNVSDTLQRSGQLLITNMHLLLIPSSVGVVTCVGLVEKEGLAIAITLSVSIVLSLILTAGIMSLLSRRYRSISKSG